jgi:hypothetical protein
MRPAASTSSPHSPIFGRVLLERLTREAATFSYENVVSCKFHSFLDRSMFSFRCQRVRPSFIRPRALHVRGGERFLPWALQFPHHHNRSARLGTPPLRRNGARAACQLPGGGRRRRVPCGGLGRRHFWLLERYASVPLGQFPSRLHAVPLRGEERTAQHSSVAECCRLYSLCFYNRPHSLLPCRKLKEV